MRIKFVCSYGGKISDGPSGGNLVYVGGTTRAIRVGNDISYQQLKEKTMAIYKQPHIITYQLPGKDLDILVSVHCDRDLRHMMRFGVLRGGAGSEKLFKVFLFAADSTDHPNVEARQSNAMGVSAESKVASGISEEVDSVSDAFNYIVNDASFSGPPSSAVSGDSEEKVGESLHVDDPSAKAEENQVSEVGTLPGRAGTAGFGKAVGVLDTLGSIMTRLRGGFVAGVATKGTKISILAFEVANTIVKGSNLMQSLSKENIKHLKEVVLPSEGVQLLISKDMDELLRIAAADKREELKIFSGEIVRFGNRCKDPQWHNLDRYFSKLESELSPQKQLREAAAGMMQNLMTMVQYTAELYHELHALDRFEQDYRRKLHEEESLSAVQRGDNLQILRQELKSQRKHLESLKKKSLWLKIFEEVMKKLVDIVQVLHLKIHDAFGSADGEKPVRKSINSHQKLGSAGLALHYANIISQIDTLVSRSSSVPPNSRDTLYQGLPPNVKSSLRSKLQSFQLKEELTVTQIKAEMEKTLQWLVPIANNTTKAHHGFGWVGEWANTGTEVNRKPAGQSDLIRIETLHHADKDKTESYMLDLVVWLHHLILQSKAGSVAMRSPIKSPNLSPTQKSTTISLHTNTPVSPPPPLTQEDKDMLRYVSLRRLTPGISKSQEFDRAKMRLSKHSRLSKSSSHSPTSENTKELLPSTRRPTIVPPIDFDIDRIKVLDVIDRVDTLRKL